MTKLVNGGNLDGSVPADFDTFTVVGTLYGIPKGVLAFEALQIWGRDGITAWRLGFRRPGIIGMVWNIAR